MTDRAIKASERIAAYIAKRRPDIMPAPWVDDFAAIIRGAFIKQTLPEEILPIVERKLDAVRQICQRHNNPSVNVGAHRLAAEILKAIGDGSEGEGDSEANNS